MREPIKHGFYFVIIILKNISISSELLHGFGESFDTYAFTMSVSVAFLIFHGDKGFARFILCI